VISGSSELADEELPHYLPDFPSIPDAIPADDETESPSIAPQTAPLSAPGPAPISNVSHESAPTFSAAPVAPQVTDDFGGSTEGLATSNAALELVRGLEGKAVRVISKGNRETFTFVAARRVTKKAGAPFKARAVVRTTSPGMYVCLRVQELGGTQRTTERCAAAKSGWRRLALKGMAAGRGHRLVFSIHVMAAAGGSSFDVDGFTLG
jgi:hypothetical protein